MLVLCLSGAAVGQEGEAQAEMDAEFERLDKMAADIEEMLGIYIIHKSKREALEGVLVKGRRAEVWFLRSLDRNGQDARCDAYRWLMLGRFGGDVGALGVFGKYPELEKLTVVYYSLETKVRSDRKGGYIQDRTPIRQLEITIDRERAGALDPKGLRATLERSRGSCIEQGEALVNNFWYVE